MLNEAIASPQSSEGALLASSSSAIDSDGDYVGNSMVAFYPVGSSSFVFYHSWPKSVHLA